MSRNLLGAMSIFWGMLIVPLFGQDQLSVSIFEYPEPLVFSKGRHFEKGVRTSLTLLVSNPIGTNGGQDHHPYSSQWELLTHAEEDLTNGSYSIPVSAISIRVKGNAQVRSKGRIFLSTIPQIIAKKKPQSTYSANSFLEVKLKIFKGDHFLQSAGKYSTFIYFTLMMD